ncbi:MAG: hypothetical protein QGD94_10725, partial [Planctomycetia bacterium]|nr:hypothetical protein [Planctomycetia bacterium]
MAKATLVTAALIVLMRASLLPAASNEVEQIYESLYGDEAKRALFTKGTVDDIALAKKLLEAAREVRKQPSLMVLLCQKAYEFGIKARPGYQTAIDAMDLVIKTVPADKLASQEKVARVFQKHFEGCKAKERARAGEELIRRLLVVADAKAATWDYEGESLYCRRALAVAKAVRSATRVPLEGRLRAVGERRRILKRVR